MASLAEAAVEIIAELDRFEPDLRRKLTAAVQSAADDAEKEFRKAGDQAGRSFADATAKAAGKTGNDPRFAAAGQVAGSQFAGGFSDRNAAALRSTEAQFAEAGNRAGNGFARAVDKTASSGATLDKLRSEISRLEAAVVKGADSQADAAGRVQVAEAALADLRTRATVSLKQQASAIEGLALAQRDAARADRAALAASENLASARESFNRRAEQAAAAIAAATRKSSEAQEAAINKVRVAEQRLAEVRSNSRSKASALTAAEAGLVAARNRAAELGADAGDQFAQALAKAAQAGSGDAGDRSGGFFARAFETAAGRAVGTGLVNVFAAGLASLVTAASPLGTILGGVAAGIIAVAGALTQAAGASIAFLGVLGSIGLAAATVKIATAGLDDAFKAQAKALAEMAADGKVSEKTQKDLAAAMKNLAPAAREVVTAVFAQAGAWRTLRTTLQQNLFEGVGDSIRQLATTFLPILTTQLGTTAALINRAARSFALFLTGSAQSAQITRIMQGLNGILAALLPSLIPLAAGFLTLFEASLPFALRLAVALGGLATKFSEFATAVTQSGDFAEFMRGAFEAAKLLLSILGNIGGIISSVFSAGAESGVGLLTVFDNLLETFRNFLDSAEGQEALGSFFSLIAAAGSALIAIFATLRPLIAGIAEVFRALEGPIQALGAALAPVIGQLAVTLGGALSTLAPQLAALVTGLTPLVGAIGAGLVAIFQALLTAVLPLVPAIVAFATALAAQIVPLIGQLVPVILTLVEAFGTFLLSLLPLVPTLISLVGPAAQLSLAFLQILVAIAPLVTLAAQLSAALLAGLAPAIVFVVGLFVQFVTSLAGAIAGLANAIRVVVDFVAQFIANFQRMRASGASLVQSLVGAIIASFGGMASQGLALVSSFVTGALSVLSGFVSSARQKAAEVASGILGAIRSGLSGLAGVFRAPFDSARAAVSSALSGILSTVEGFVSRISGAISRISSAIGNIPRPNFPGINLPFLAKGGLTRGPSIAGEAGPEVVIPLTKPRRRDELLEKYFGGWADTKAWAGGAGYGGKTKEIHMPINVVGLSKDETVQVLHGIVDQRIGSSIGITTSVGAL